MKKPFLLLLISMVLYQTPIKAEGGLKSVLIEVTDKGTSSPIIDAIVMVKSTSIGTVTDINGTAILICPADAVLVISSIDYKTQEVPVNNESIIYVELEIDE